MHLQEYFVRLRCELRVRELRFDNIESASPAAGVEQAILESDAVIICPSNPFISINPILAVPGIRDALRNTKADVIAITPVIGGRAVKGPTADMLGDLGHEVSARGVAALYSDFIKLFVLDEKDKEIQSEIESLGLKVVVTDTIMKTIEDKRRLARQVIEFLTSGK
jgi:LPPG:FO 2-phospho-L-lactate transferase